MVTVSYISNPVRHSHIYFLFDEFGSCPFTCHFRCQDTSHRQECSYNPPAFHAGLLEDAGNHSLCFYPSVKETAQFVEIVFTCQRLLIDPTQCSLPLAQVVIKQTKTALLKYFLTLYNPQSSTCTKPKKHSLLIFFCSLIYF